MRPLSDQPVVGNAASRKQLETARQKEQLEAEQWLADIRELLHLESGAGRRVLWGVLAQCKVLESIWVQSSEIYYNAGRQDIGHWILAQLEKADQRALLSLMEEQYNHTLKEQRTNAR